METIETSAITLEITTCCVCGIHFAAPVEMMNEKRKNAGSIYCPNGHSLSWRETEAQKLERQLQLERQRHDQTRADRDRIAAESARKQRQLYAARGRLTRFKNKSAAGKCNCCGKEFMDLKIHMAQAHPGFVGHAKETRDDE